MALSPWEKHRMSLSAQQSSQLGGHVSRNTQGYHMMLLRLATDKKELKHFQSRERKEAYKRKILPIISRGLMGHCPVVAVCKMMS